MCVYRLPRIPNGPRLRKYVALDISLHRKGQEAKVATTSQQSPDANPPIATPAQQKPTTTYWEVIRLGDLPILCQVLGHIFGIPPTRFICMDFPIGAEETQPWIHKTAYAYLDVVLQASVISSTEHGGLSAKHESAVLESLQKVTGRGISLRCEGFRRGAVSHSRPTRLIWPRALLWDWLEVMLACKGQADALAIQGKDCSARLLFQGTQRYTQSTLDALPASSMDTAYVRLRALCELVMWDVAISYAQLMVQSSDANAASPAVDYVLETVDAGRLPHATNMIIIALVLDFRIALYLSPDPTTDEQQRLERRRGVEIWQDTAESHKSQGDTRLMSTAQVAREALSLTDGSTTSEAYEHLQKQRRSWRLLPFQVVDSRRELDKQTRPCEMVGWQDRKHLALLTFAQREAIKTLQRENGWPDELESSTSPH